LGFGNGGKKDVGGTFAGRTNPQQGGKRNPYRVKSFLKTYTGSGGRRGRGRERDNLGRKEERTDEREKAHPPSTELVE